MANACIFVFAGARIVVERWHGVAGIAMPATARRRFKMCGSKHSRVSQADLLGMPIGPWISGDTDHELSCP